MNDLTKAYRNRKEPREEVVFDVEIVLPLTALHEQDRELEDAIDTFRAYGSFTVHEAASLPATDGRRLDR